ncbi:type I restriction-modification system specificity subunit, partial [mine drainage metagenome]
DLYAAGGGQPNINQEIIANLRIPAPILVDQAGIATFLDRETSSIDTLIAKVQRSIDLLKERRSTFITAGVTGRIDLRGGS